MRYEHLLLEHFGVHAKLEVTPSPGLTGIVGRNGSGKSTVLAAFEYLATGRIPTDGTKECNIAALAPPKSRSAVSGVLTHDGHRLEIVRGLQKAKTSLKVDGGEAIEGEAKVNAELARIFDDAYPLLGPYVFVKQDEIYGFIQATPAVRAEAFATLFGTKKADVCRALVAKRLGQFVVPAPVDLDNLKRALGDEREALAVARRQLKKFADLKDYDPGTDPDAAVVARRKAYLDAHKEVQAAETALVDLRKRQAQADITHNETIQRWGQLSMALGPVNEDADAAAAALATWKAYRRWAKARADLDKRYEALTADHLAHPKPEPREHYIQADDMTRLQLLMSLQTSIAWAEKLLKTFKDGVAECPTCGTPSENLKDEVAKARDSLPQYRKTLEGVQLTITADRQFERALENWKTWKAGYKARLAQYEKDAAALEEELDAPVSTQEELQGVVDRRKELQEAVQAAHEEVSSARAAHSRLVGLVDAASARVRAARVKRKENRTSKEEAKAAAVRLRKTTARLHTRGEVLGTVIQLKKNVAVREAEVAKAEADEAVLVQTRKLVDRLGSARDVLRDLPRLTAAGYLDVIQTGVNDLLTKFGADFRVEAADDLSYTASFHAGPKSGVRQPAARLSFGEKVLLALAFRVEVNGLFAGKIGLLALDEPTQFLDQTNVDCLEPALAQLRSLSATRGLQCVMVTHERRLDRLFDTVIAL